MANRSPQRLFSYLLRLIVVGLAPLAIGMVLLIVIQARDIRAKQAARLNTLAEQAVNGVDSELKRRIGTLQAIATASAAREQASLRDWYEAARAYDQKFGSPVVLSDMGRHRIFDTRVPFGESLPPLPRPPGRSSLERAIETGEPHVGNMVRGPITESYIMPLALPAGERPSMLVWIAPIKADQMLEMLKSIAPPDGWGVALLDSAGQTIARHGMDTKALLTDASGPRKVSIALTEAPWSVVAYASAWAFYGPMVVLGGMLLLLLGFTLGLAAWLANRSGRALNAAMETLLDAPRH